MSYSILLENNSPIWLELEHNLDHEIAEFEACQKLYGGIVDE